MKIQELFEGINPDILKSGYRREKTINTTKGTIRLVAQQLGRSAVYPELTINAYNAQGEKIAYTRFTIRNLEKWKIFLGNRKRPEQAHLIAGNVSVWRDYQKLGIAREMYRFANQLGNDIEPSPVQTDQGKAMWRSFRKQDFLS
jgi:hypothetical protein